MPQRIFVDTSVLLADYRAESFSDIVATTLRQPEQTLVINHLSKVEFSSAVARWTRTNEIDIAQGNIILNTFEKDLHAQCLELLPITTAHYQTAYRWLAQRSTALRSLDALHLASAFLAEIPLLSADQQLCAAAQHFGVEHQLITG